MEEKKFKQVNVVLDKETADKFKVLCIENNTTMRAELLKFILKYIETN